MPRMSVETRKALRKFAHDELRWDVVALCTDLDKADAEIVRLRVALTEVAKAEGPFSRDRLTHATNVIESMVSIATEALAPAKGEDKP